MFNMIKNIKNFVPEDRFCCVSKFISQQGKNINLAERVTPEFEGDTGWRFYWGSEKEENPDLWEICTLNIVCNYDENVFTIINKTIGTAMERGTKSGKFVANQQEDEYEQVIYNPNFSFNSDIPIEFYILPEKQFQTVFETVQQEVDLKSEDCKNKFRDRIFETQDVIRAEVGKLCEDEDDFEVSYDFYALNYYTCSGVYSLSIFNEGLIRAIMRGHSALEEGEKWSHDVVFECGDDNGDYLGEIIIQHNKVYISDEMPPKYRKLLGCSK